MSRLQQKLWLEQRVLFQPLQERNFSMVQIRRVLHGPASSQRVRTKVLNFLGYLFQVASSAARRLTKDTQLGKTDRRRRSWRGLLFDQLQRIKKIFGSARRQRTEKKRNAFHEKRPVWWESLRADSRKPRGKEHRRGLQSWETHNRESQNCFRVQDSSRFHSCNGQSWRLPLASRILQG